MEGFARGVVGAATHICSAHSSVACCRDVVHDSMASHPCRARGYSLWLALSRCAVKAGLGLLVHSQDDLLSFARRVLRRLILLFWTGLRKEWHSHGKLRVALLTAIEERNPQKCQIFGKGGQYI